MDPEQIAAAGCDHPEVEPPRTPTGDDPPVPTAQTLAAFGLPVQQPAALPHGEERAYRVGNAVLKHIHRDRPEVVSWVANLHAGLSEDGYRLARPLPTQDGGWITDDGWSATTFLAGHHDYRPQVEACIVAITRYHAALKSQPRPDLFDTDCAPYRRADRYAFGERPATVHPDLEVQADALYALRRPLGAVEDQLIHGDLNPSNLLIAPGQPPGIIDMVPYWRPAGFALAVFAYWIGPWRDRPDFLAHFAHVEQFDQLLIRAGIRMLLIMSESGRLADLERYTRATTAILKHCGR